ncbi:hypothetical protein HPP92_020074 [Vanilla planifolia]|uniref:Uncharacterized protein n=1 Tax=Vanilla planifolia TaxID=51239 RepID=A0A835UKF6_VANPL|nr:hypothetical protein HPP92_020074 [Vanilla planifolia]
MIQPGYSAALVSRSSALDITERRLGRGLNAARRRCWCDEGRISAVSARFTHSPSTVPIRTSELVIADRRAFSRLDGEETECREESPLWRLQRKDPGWLVGEHMQVFRGGAAGEIGRLLAANWSSERERGDPTRLMRVGEADRWGEKSQQREAKVEAGETEKAVAEDEAKAELTPVGEENRPIFPAPEKKRPVGERTRKVTRPVEAPPWHRFLDDVDAIGIRSQMRVRIARDEPESSERNRESG